MPGNVRLEETLRSLVAVVRTQQLTFLAAAIAYYAFVSIVPLVAVTLAVASTVVGPGFAADLIGLVEGFLTEETALLARQSLASEAGRGSATVLSVGVLGWSSLRVFRGLDVAFSRVYGAELPLSLLAQLRDALVVLAAMGIGLAATVALGPLVPLADVPVPHLFGSLGLVAVLVVVFFPLYYVFPDQQMAVREALPGSILAGVGWTVLGTGFGLYTEQVAGTQVYGLLGAVLLALSWFYFGGLLVLLGAALNAVLADGPGPPGGPPDRQLQQGSLRESTQRMSEPEGEEGDDVATVEPESVDYEDFAQLRRDLEQFEEEIEDRTVHREDLEADLKRYVRRRVRRGHARGWGPYLVLLYGTAMTLGAFYYLSGPWAVLAMVVIWLSTLGLYALMVIVGVTVTTLGLPGRALDRLRDFRS